MWGARVYNWVRSSSFYDPIWSRPELVGLFPRDSPQSNHNFAARLRARVCVCVDAALGCCQREGPRTHIHRVEASIEITPASCQSAMQKAAMRIAALQVDRQTCSLFCLPSTNQHSTCHAIHSQAMTNDIREIFSFIFRFNYGPD